MIGDLFSPVFGAIKAVFSFFGGRAETPMKRLEAHLVDRGIIAELPYSIPLQIVDGNNVPHKAIYILAIVIWNRGKLAITPDDFVPSAPLQLKLGSDASLVHVKHLAADEQLKVKIEQIDSQRAQVSFDCLNPNHWMILPLIYTGNPRADVSLTGRIIGQDGPIDQTALEVRARPKERIAAALALLFLANAVIGTPISGWMIQDRVGLLAFVKDPYIVSRPLSAVFCLGITAFLIAGLQRAMNWHERRQFPEGYPFLSDVEPKFWASVKGLWATLYKAKKQRISTSLFDWGKPVLFTDKHIKRRSVDDWVV